MSSWKMISYGLVEKAITINDRANIHYTGPVASYHTKLYKDIIIIHDWEGWYRVVLLSSLGYREPRANPILLNKLPSLKEAYDYVRCWVEF